MTPKAKEIYEGMKAEAKYGLDYGAETIYLLNAKLDVIMRHSAGLTSMK